jgi:hypothetical protein
VNAGPALALLEQSRQCLAQAYAAELAAVRLVTSQDAAMRAAAALVAGRGTRGPQDLWPLLAAQSPELAEWAEVFALAAVRRQQLETLCPELLSADRRAHQRCPVRVPVREADDLLRAAETFVELVAVTLVMPRGERTVRRLASVRESA